MTINQICLIIDWACVVSNLICVVIHLKKYSKYKKAQADIDEQRRILDHKSFMLEIQESYRKEGLSGLRGLDNTH